MVNFYVYILECNDGKKYYGHTNNLTRRLTEHKNGKVRYTKNKRPIQLVWFDRYLNRNEVSLEERKLKSMHDKRVINRMINSMPKGAVKAYEI